jgi:hypothetical protein
VAVRLSEEAERGDEEGANDRGGFKTDQVNHVQSYHVPFPNT